MGRGGELTLVGVGIGHRGKLAVGGGTGQEVKEEKGVFRGWGTGGVEGKVRYLAQLACTPLPPGAPLRTDFEQQ